MVRHVKCKSGSSCSEFRYFARCYDKSHDSFTIKGLPFLIKGISAVQVLSDAIQVISQMHSMKIHYGFNGKIMGAGIRELTTALTCIEMGICAITLSEKVFTEFIQDNEPTLLALEKFSEDWSKSIFSRVDFYSLRILNEIKNPLFK